MKVKITDDSLKLFSRSVKDAQKHSLKASKEIQNHLANATKKELQEKISVVFDRPTPYAINSVANQMASGSNPAKTFIKDKSSGIAGEKFLSAQIEGGGRKHKRFEKALIAKGIMRKSEYAMPTKRFSRDQYGNVPASKIVQLLSYLQAFQGAAGGSSRRINMTDKTKARLNKGNKKNAGFEYFVGDGVTHARGVWHKTKYRVVPLLIFTKEPSYSRRFDFYGIIQAVHQRRYQDICNKHFNLM